MKLIFYILVILLLVGIYSAVLSVNKSIQTLIKQKELLNKENKVRK